MQPQSAGSLWYHINEYKSLLMEHSEFINDLTSNVEKEEMKQGAAEKMAAK